jgi:murein L,D-transpeptidase YafK
MTTLSHGRFKGRSFAIGVLALAAVVAGCSAPEIHPSQRPLPKDTLMLLGKKGMSTGSAIFVRIFKEESELEVWKARDDGRFYHFKTYPICNWSGELGPKLKEGDKQAPEGFYSVSRGQMNPNSQFYLAFNLGYPNAFDKAHGRTGSALMVHGKCRSAGCYAMTDGLMEELYALVREAFDGGQSGFQVHAFPFRMTKENMERHKRHAAYPFWRTLKEGYDHFELTRQTPDIAVCARRYHVNVRPIGHRGRIDPAGACPAFARPKPEPFSLPGSEQMAETKIKVPGPKLRTMALSDDELYRAVTNAERATSRTAGLGVFASPRASSPVALGFNQ